MSFSKDQLSPLFLEVFHEVRGLLRDSFGQRLTGSRGVRNHGDHGNLYLFNIWDKYQNDLLHRDHFCYCFGYYTNRMVERDGGFGNSSYLHLWINTTRLYYKRSLILKLLEDPIRSVTPAPFSYVRTDHAISVVAEFPFINDFKAFKDFIIPLYISLISAMHPTLIPVIDLCKTPLSKDERRAVVQGRSRPRISGERRQREEARNFGRYCPNSWRHEILAAHGFQCVHCGVQLTVDSAQMDHIIPWSKMPIREKTNFQPLCASCNAKKGNRYSG